MNEKTQHKYTEESLLESVKGMERATAPAFFYTRLKARMEKEKMINPVFRWFTQPAVSLSFVAVVLIMNIMTITKMFRSPDPDTDFNEIATIMASEYGIANYPVYDEIPAE